MKLNNVPLLVMLLSALLFTSCAKKMRFEVSREVPAAEGVVKVKKDDNNNYKVNLKVIRLSPSERLSPPKNTYVVWMDTDLNGTINIGNLGTSKGIFSKKLKSSLETVTPYQPVRFFITAENDKRVEYPGNQIVLRTRYYN
ncbi:hypothetical protein [Dyadobacter sediminis]|nr:hypothetical protein [Dyadobacter sediminis]